MPVHFARRWTSAASRLVEVRRRSSTTLAATAAVAPRDVLMIAGNPETRAGSSAPA